MRTPCIPFLAAMGLLGACRIFPERVEKFPPPYGERLYPVAALCAGDSYTCALHQKGLGTTYCWGSNAFGQWGNGSTVTTLTGGLSLAGDAARLACNAGTTCVADFAGRLRCFGRNGSGQIGTGSQGGNVLSPFEVIPDSVVAVAVGWTHTCAVKDTGTVSCWGNNSYGQLGIGVPGDQLTPALVTGITDAYDVVAGNVHTCMLHQDDAIQCWGFNRQGQLGPKGKEIQLKPVGGPALKAIQLAAGAFHTCALKTDRTVWCWGSNDHGQLGRTTTGDHDANAAAVPGIAGASRIATGAYHSCAVHSGGSVSCWGANENGQSGADPSAKQVGPTAVPLPTAYDIAAGYAHSCALVAGGRLKCWGENKFGELTDGTNKSSWKPVP